MVEYNALTGDTLGRLWKKIRGVTNILRPAGTDPADEQEPLLDESKDRAADGDQDDKKDDKKDAGENRDDEANQALDDITKLVVDVLGDKVGFIIGFLISLLKVALTDLLVICFFATQELMDTSNIHGLNMKAIYTPGSITFGIIVSKIVMNGILVALVHVFSAKCITVYEGHCVGVIAIYVICAYEFLFYVLVNLSHILQLDSVQSNPTTGAA